jgi:hypothetical protein
MKDVICAGCSFTSFRLLEAERVLEGVTPPIDGISPLGSYPEAIHRNFGNRVYNSGMAGNNVATSVLSIISTANRLLKEGNTNLSVILQCTEFTRQSFYFPSNFQIRKNIGIDTSNVRNNNYLFTDDNSGHFQFGTISNVSDGFSDYKEIVNIAKAFSDNIYSIEYCYINSLVHILLLQNFCKANNIPYKIFCKTESFSIPFYPIFKLDEKDEETYFKSYFLDKKLVIKKPLTFVQSDSYVNDLFKMLDLNGFWFYEDVDIKYGGITEWVYARNQYREGDKEYTALFVEDIEGNPTNEKDIFPIERAKERMKEGRFCTNGHPSYYYWDLFTKNEITKWGVL